MDLSLGTTSFPAVMGSSRTRWWLQLGAFCHASSFAPARVYPHSRYTSCLPQVKKSGYSWAMTGFGFVSSRTDPLECAVCVASVGSWLMLCILPQLSSSRVSWDMQIPPSFSSFMCCLKERIRCYAFFLQVFVFLLLCDKVFASTTCLASNEMP